MLMSNTNTDRDKMAQDLVGFWSNDDGSEHYNEFRNYWSGVVGMAVDKYLLGWVSEISEAGYQKIEEAHAELISLGYEVDEDDDLF